MSKTVLIALIAVAFVLVTCVAGIIAGGAWIAANAKLPEGVTVVVDHPASAQVGERFNIVVTIDNKSGADQRVFDIDFGDGYLQGIMIHTVDPAPAQTSSGLGMTTHTFGRTVSAGEHLVVTFECEPIAAGDYSGDIDVYVGSQIGLTTHFARTIIQAP